MANDAVAGYGWTDAGELESARYVTPGVLRALRRLRAQRVLDVGAGNGALCAALAAAGYDVCGIEHDAQGVAIARAAHPRLSFHRRGVEDDPAELLRETGPFDAVVSTEVVEHLYAPRQLPRYARAVLCRDGHLIVTTPYHGYLKNAAIALSGRWDRHHTALWDGGHIKFWSRDTLGRLLEDEGFRVTAFAGLGRVPLLWKSMLMVARRV